MAKLLNIVGSNMNFFYYIFGFAVGAFVMYLSLSEDSAFFAQAQASLASCEEELYTIYSKCPQSCLPYPKELKL